MVLQNHRPLHREIFTDEVVLPALSHHTPPSPHKNSPSRPKARGGIGVYGSARAQNSSCSAVLRSRSAKSKNAPRSCSASDRVKPSGRPLPSCPLSL